jgi:hypothetical protein
MFFTARCRHRRTADYSGVPLKTFHTTCLKMTTIITGGEISPRVSVPGILAVHKRHEHTKHSSSGRFPDKDVRRYTSHSARHKPRRPVVQPAKIYAKVAEPEKTPPTRIETTDIMRCQREVVVGGATLN